MRGITSAAAVQADGTRVTKSASVRVEGLKKAIGGATLLANVDLHVNAGEFVTLLGASGSGKTSTLMAIAGFLTPDAGRITVGDRDVTRVPPGRERDMGIVFQNYALFPHMTVAQNVAYPLKVRHLPRQQIKARVAKVLELVQLTPLADRKPAWLSGGQQQRVALARALVFEPSVLLMDEPMGALDVRLKEELQWEIRRLQREIGATVIYVTHDQHEAMLLSDRVALMRDGRIEQYSTAQELYQRPETLFAARFLGDSNLLKGRLSHTAGPALEVAGTHLRLPAEQADGKEDGALCAALLRPEVLAIQPAGLLEEPPPGCFITGMVKDLAFVGQSIRYEFECELMDVTMLIHQVARSGHTQLSPGSRAVVSWDPRDIHLIKMDGSHG
ncbi:ABC transporter ATP-binding protein [Sodalis sp. RH16]|uniref:ABC transporter ATP-binding protein n=1 Tax=unclassified Sodalis (in: enterobacteria) TaxID=2636512 RepID=UPI0039B553A7